MKETIMKRIFNVVGISALAIVWLACHDGGPYGLQIQEQQDKATVSFSVIGARTVLPQQVSLADVASYQLLGELNSGAETVLVDSFTGKGTFVSLAPGMWNFTLNAYNSANNHILYGTVENKQINLTGTNQVRFSLSMVNSGTGTIQITLNFPASAGITRIGTNGDIDSETFTPVGNGSFVYTKSEVAAGDHLINFELYRGDIPRAVVSELVLVRNGLTSSATIAVAVDDLKPILTGTVSIMGTAVVGQTLAADTYYLDGVGNISYRWKLTNGETITEIGTDSDTYTVQAADAGGVITVTVTRTGYGGDMSSAPTVPLQ
jgi:hypothetical protein